MMTYCPNTDEVERCQRELNLDKMQAYYHLQGRRRALEHAERERQRRVRECIERFARPERDGSMA